MKYLGYATLFSIVIGIFVWFGFSLHWTLTVPNTDSYIVLDKEVVQYPEYKTFLEVRYENGDVDILREYDPISSKKYVIGNKYTLDRYHGAIPAKFFFGYVFFICLAFIMIGVFKFNLEN